MLQGKQFEFILVQLVTRKKSLKLTFTDKTITRSTENIAARN